MNQRFLTAVSLAAVLTVGVTLPPTAHAQGDRSPRQPERIRSLGQPPRIKPYVGVSTGAFLDSTHTAFLGLAQVGVFKDLLSPLAGILGVSLEAYGGLRGHQGVDGGGRLSLSSPYFGLSAGTDYNIRDNSFDLLLSLALPVQRGGLLRTGGVLRIDWLPTRGNTITLGAVFPVRQPLAGETRPYRDRVKLTKHSWEPVYAPDTDTALTEGLANVRGSALRIGTLTTPFLDQDGDDADDAIANFAVAVDELKTVLGERTVEEEIRWYHEQVTRAFARASADGSLGREAAHEAKTILLDRVILPYDQLLGVKKKNDTVLEFAPGARAAFAAWIAQSSIPADRRDAVQYVFDQMIHILDAVRERSRQAWADSRLVWIPLQLALLPEQHDTQAEIDAIVEQALEVEFEGSNVAWYVFNQQVQWEYNRTIRAAEDYHVLWIHDYKGPPDPIAYFQTTSGYLTAMIERVRAYDATGRFPVYLIFQDQFYYEGHGSRSWMTLLENPLSARIEFPEGYEAYQTELDSLQLELRQAVASSDRLQEEVERYGTDWLTNRIKVHVNITNPADHTFLSGAWLPVFAFPDNLMRDHRKIAFYDVTEADPFKGGAIYSGAGIGENYVGTTWDDRSTIIEGPVLLQLKSSARELLLNQGMSEEDIPAPLKPHPRPANYDALVLRARDPFWPGRALQIHNQTGYRPKPITVYKAVLYTLMPRGSVLKIPDSLWNGPFQASQLIGAALRGCRVYVVGPAAENAASPGFPQMSRLQELMERLVMLQSLLRTELAAADGTLRVGLYNVDLDVDDIPGRVKLWADRVRSDPLLRALYPFPQGVFDLADRIDEVLPDWAAEHPVVGDTVRKPKLHLKANFFSSMEGWDRLLQRPEWADWLELYLRERARVEEEQDTYTDARDAPDVMYDLGQRLLEGMFEELTPAQRERVIYQLIVGSSNHDYRSMLLDGEVGLVITDLDALIAIVDMTLLFGSATWIEDRDELVTLLPRYSEFQRRIGRLVKAAL